MLITLRLLPCARCKGPATIYVSYLTRYGTQFAVGCKNKACGVTTGFVPKETPYQLEARWNKGIGLTRAGTPYKQVPGQMQMLEVFV